MNFEQIQQTIAHRAKDATRRDIDHSLMSPKLPQSLRKRQPLLRQLKDFAYSVKDCVYKIPLLGRLAKWMIVLLRIDVRVHQLIEANLQLRDQLIATENHFTERLSSLQLSLAPRFDHLAHQLSVVMDNLSDLKLTHSKALALSGPHNQSSAPPAPQMDLGKLYVAFEDQFRGSAADLRKRFEDYRPHLLKVGEKARSLPCLDIGCGRGEWLQYLQELNFKVQGVDSNSGMVEATKKLGIPATYGDGIEFLSQQKAQSFGVVSALHVVEHLPLDILIRLIDECFRVLCSGGVAIFETPNPENILVGACHFYTDPTHRNPIPPHTLDFLVLRRGFDHTTVLRKSLPNIALESQDPAVSFMLEWFKKPQDYAILAYKA